MSQGLSNKTLFEALYSCKDENELEKFISQVPDLFKQDNWFPLNYLSFTLIKLRFY